ncbi:MAG: S24 family peptidase, partial [Candidatus Acidiferrum sp.]
MPERKSIEKRNSAQFAAVCEALLDRGAKVRFRAQGQSMQPNILDNDAVIVAPAEKRDLQRGDVVLAHGADGFRVHRVLRKGNAEGEVVTRGDSGRQNDAAASPLGKVIAIERGGRMISLAGASAAAWHALCTQKHRLTRAGACRMRRFRTILMPSLVILFALLLHAASAAAQTLSITDTGAPTTLGPGGTITYTQVLTNTSLLSVTHPLTVTQNLPANTTFVSAAKTAGTDNWTCVNTAGVITCSDTSPLLYLGGSTTTFTVVLTVNAGTPNGTVITDTVSAQGANTAVAAASANVTVQTPDLSVTETVAPNPVATGANITYTETVTNGSAAAAGGAVLTQNTPTATLFQSVTPPAGWTCGTKPAVGATGAINCSANGNFATGSVVFTVVVAVSPEAVPSSTITNSVTVSETGTDPNLANNTATASVLVQGADLSMTQAASATAIAPSGTITYTETVTNNGPSAATAAVLYQQTPPNTTFSSITPPVGWTCGTAPTVGGTGTVLCSASAA